MGGTFSRPRLSRGLLLVCYRWRFLVSEQLKSKEPQYQIHIDTLNDVGPVQMGPTASHTWRSDPILRKEVPQATLAKFECIENEWGEPIEAIAYKDADEIQALEGMSITER